MLDAQFASDSAEERAPRTVLHADTRRVSATISLWPPMHGRPASRPKECQNRIGESVWDEHLWAFCQELLTQAPSAEAAMIPVRAGGEKTHGHASVGQAAVNHPCACKFRPSASSQGARPVSAPLPTVGSSYPLRRARPAAA